MFTRKRDVTKEYSALKNILLKNNELYLLYNFKNNFLEDYRFAFSYRSKNRIYLEI
ncbi:hypothetical protein PUN28_012961 [Cardiocondyla obscurior]|uniref:Ribosomal protein L20 n=1 Tax=Cardiocondyla obscurior TaxID=286306 RepID=A0AAW2F692_9HYME